MLLATDIVNMLTQWEFNIKMGEDRIHQIITIKDTNRKKQEPTENESCPSFQVVNGQRLQCLRQILPSSLGGNS
jgi:hypothetical protein